MSLITEQASELFLNTVELSLDAYKPARWQRLLVYLVRSSVVPRRLRLLPSSSSFRETRGLPCYLP
jgi:hypothetical protein